MLVAEKVSTKEIEEGLVLAPKFDADGLVTCVATDAKSGELLMVAHMNAEALKRTVETGEAWYFSRSRKALWKKGESSGHTQRVVEMRVDCDQDAVWIKVEQQGRAPATPGGGPASTAWCRSSRPARSRSNSATPTRRSTRRHIWQTPADGPAPGSSSPKSPTRAASSPASRSITSASSTRSTAR